MILQSDNGREFVNYVLDELKPLWLECIIFVRGRPKQSQSQESIERANQNVEHNNVKSMDARQCVPEMVNQSSVCSVCVIK